MNSLASLFSYVPNLTPELPIDTDISTAAYSASKAIDARAGAPIAYTLDHTLLPRLRSAAKAGLSLLPGDLPLLSTRAISLIETYEIKLREDPIGSAGEALSHFDVLGMVVKEVLPHIYAAHGKTVRFYNLRPKVQNDQVGGRHAWVEEGGKTLVKVGVKIQGPLVHLLHAGADDLTSEDGDTIPVGQRLEGSRAIAAKLALQIRDCESIGFGIIFSGLYFMIGQRVPAPSNTEGSILLLSPLYSVVSPTLDPLHPDLKADDATASYPVPPSPQSILGLLLTLLCSPLPGFQISPPPAFNMPIKRHVSPGSEGADSLTGMETDDSWDAYG